MSEEQAPYEARREAGATAIGYLEVSDAFSESGEALSLLRRGLGERGVALGRCEHRGGVRRYEVSGEGIEAGALYVGVLELAAESVVRVRLERVEGAG